LLALCLALLCAPAFALDVAVVVSQRDGVHKAFADAFKRAAAGLGRTADVEHAVAEGLDDVALARADLVVASGEAAAELALARHARPTLVTMIARSRFEALRSAYPQAPLSAMWLDQPVERRHRQPDFPVPDDVPETISMADALDEAVGYGRDRGMAA